MTRPTMMIVGLKYENDVQECDAGNSEVPASGSKRILRVIKILRFLKIMRLLKGIKLVEWASHALNF